MRKRECGKETNRKRGGTEKERQWERERDKLGRGRKRETTDIVRK